jgi:hypothetical protein
VTTPQEAVDRPVFDEIDEYDDDAEDRAFRDSLRKRRLMTPATKVLAGALVLVITFLAGAYVHDVFGTTSGGASGLPNLPEGFDPSALGGGGAFPQGGGGLGQAGGAVTGTIQLVDGDVVYVEAVDGSITKVKLTDDTSITLAQDASAADLAPSQVIVVQGEADEDGTVTAESISESGDAAG